MMVVVVLASWDADGFRRGRIADILAATLPLTQRQNGREMSARRPRET